MADPGGRPPDDRGRSRRHLIVARSPGPWWSRRGGLRCDEVAQVGLAARSTASCARRASGLRPWGWRYGSNESAIGTGTGTRRCQSWRTPAPGGHRHRRSGARSSSWRRPRTQYWARLLQAWPRACDDRTDRRGGTGWARRSVPWLGADRREPGAAVRGAVSGLQVLADPYRGTGSRTGSLARLRTSTRRRARSGPAHPRGMSAEDRPAAETRKTRLDPLPSISVHDGLLWVVELGNPSAPIMLYLLTVVSPGPRPVSIRVDDPVCRDRPADQRRRALNGGSHPHVARTA